jgi:alpha-glucosidase
MPGGRVQAEWSETLRVLLIALIALFLAGPAASAQEVERREHGLAAKGAYGVIEIVALRDDVLRLRVGPQGTLPPDESWAALAASRQSGAKVRPDGDNGFATQTVSVRIDAASGAFAVTDLAGREIAASSAASRPLGNGFRVDLRLAAQTRLFGLGDKMGPLDRRGRLFALWNTDAFRFQESTDPLYKSIPFFIGMNGSRAFGVFLDNSFRSHFDFGASRRDILSFGANGGAIDYYIFTGPDPKQVLAAYGWLTGYAPLPPLWAFGFQQSRHGYGKAAEIRAVAQRLRRDHIPSDVIWFDIDVLDGYRAFTMNRAEFPDFAKFVGELDALGFRSVVITDLHIAAQAGYKPFDSGMAGDHFLKNPDGTLYLGEVWPGLCAFPDFSRQATRQWWGGLYRQYFLEDGVAGFWDDMNEPAVFKAPGKTMPAGVVHRIDEPGFRTRTATHAEMHNLVGLLNSRATYEGLLALDPDRRPFVMTRATFAGGQRYAVTWTGDNSSTWNHLRLSTPQLLSLGLSGLPFVGVDLGGYAGTPSPELLTEWIALGMYNPIARDHSQDISAPQEVWVHGERQEDLRRAAIEGRYRLLPYIYTMAEEAARTGVPMMRPLFLEFPDTTLDATVGSEFMWGASLLVAPSPWPESPAPYKILLPEGGWYEFGTGRRVEGNELTVPPDGARIPVFVRAGSIIPMQPLVQNTRQIPDGPLILEIYPGPDCHGDIYADDGVSLAYRRGEFFRQRFSCSEAADGTVEIGLSAPEGSYRPWWRSIEVRLHGRAAKVKLIDDPFTAQSLTL